MAPIQTQYLAAALEAAWGTSPIIQSSTTYKLGVIHADAPLPFPKNSFFATNPGASSRLAASLYQGTRIPQGRFGFAPIDGFPFLLALGASSTAGAGPYTHTLTFAAPGATPKSVTMHVEGDAAITWQLLGMVMKTMNVMCGVTPEEDILKCVCDWTGKKASLVAFQLDNKPVARISDVPYTFGDLLSANGAYTFGGSTLTGLERFSFTFGTGFDVYLTQHLSGGSNISYEPVGTITHIVDRPRVTLQGCFENDAFIDEAIVTSYTKDLVLKLARGANDYITFTFGSCAVEQPLVRLQPPGDTIQQTITLIPSSFTIEVKDSLAGSVYGE